MSYCVNCGVELDKTAKKCALCKVVVINPLQQQDTVSPVPYPVSTDKFTTRERHYVVQILSIALVLQAAVCVILNIFYFNKSYWSAYSIGAFVLVFTMAALPLLFKKPFLFFITMDGIVMLGYLYMVEWLSGTSHWFLSIALPITVFILMSTIALYFYAVKWNPGKLRITAATLFGVGLLAVCIDGSISMYIYQSLRCSWSFVVLACCGALGLAFYVTSRNKRIHNELSKRFHL